MAIIFILLLFLQRQRQTLFIYKHLHFLSVVYTFFSFVLFSFKSSISRVCEHAFLSLSLFLGSHVLHSEIFPFATIYERSVRQIHNFIFFNGLISTDCGLNSSLTSHTDSNFDFMFFWYYQAIHLNSEIVQRFCSDSIYSATLSEWKVSVVAYSLLKESSNTRSNRLRAITIMHLMQNWAQLN